MNCQLLLRLVRCAWAVQQYHQQLGGTQVLQCMHATATITLAL